jgi:hypothetical protein
VAENEERSPSIPWLPLITLIMVGSGVLLSFQQLTSSRPGGGDARLAATTFGDQTINARLWQDPLGVATADAGWSRNDSKAHTIGQFQSIFIVKCFGPLPIYPLKEDFLFAEQKKQVQILATQVQILAVMIPGGPYVEDVERRLRSRRAVIEGLATAHYDPENDHEIGYFCVPWRPLNPNVADCVSTLEKNRDKDEAGRFAGNAIQATRNYKESDGQDSDRHPLVVPYEWCEPTSLGSHKGPVHVLVLWLNDAAFRDAPLARLADLISWFRLKLFGARGEEVSLPLPIFTVLGPDNSGTLHQMVIEAKEHRWNNETRRCLATTHIYSNQAWAAENRLLYGSPDKCKNLIEQEVKQREPDSDFCFERINLLDNDIVDSLWQELDRRGVKKNDHIAIISEEDTYYARALRSTFAASDVNGQELPNVHPYTYLRGIDGKLPSSGKDAKEANDLPESTEKNTQSSLQPRERTEGLSQADDIRRLAGKLQELDTKLRRGGGRLKAIGLLGSDVYDKLELLKALRPGLPEAVFFTNNLDARLGHPDEWSETHNLIVVSARGLSLENDQNVPSPESYHKVPPFRDSAQTALFEATLEAMGYMPPIPKSPLIFEIGRNGPKRLGIADDRGELFRYLLRLGCFITFGSLLVAWAWLVSRVALVNSNAETRPEDIKNEKLTRNDDLVTGGAGLQTT